MMSLDKASFVFLAFDFIEILYLTGIDYTHNINGITRHISSSLFR